MRRIAPAHLLAGSAAALAGFAYTARLVARRRTATYDHQARDDVQGLRAPSAEAAAEASGHLGKEYVHFPVAAGLGLVLQRRGMGARAAVPVLASFVSEVLNRVVTRTVHIRVVPPGHPERHNEKPSFPSGHAMESAAVALTSAYILAREEIAGGGPAFGVAGLLIAASTAGRLVLDRHWVSDALGGALLGVCVAAACAATYESLPS